MVESYFVDDDGNCVLANVNSFDVHVHGIDPHAYFIKVGMVGDCDNCVR